MRLLEDVKTGLSVSQNAGSRISIGQDAVPSAWASFPCCKASFEPSRVLDIWFWPGILETLGTAITAVPMDVLMRSGGIAMHSLEDILGKELDLGRCASGTFSASLSISASGVASGVIGLTRVISICLWAVGADKFVLTETRVGGGFPRLEGSLSAVLSQCIKLGLAMTASLDNDSVAVLGLFWYSVAAIVETVVVSGTILG